MSELAPGLVLVRGGRARRIIAVLPVRGVVAYSRGGSDRNGLCKLKTWKRWARAAVPAAATGP